MFPQVEKEIVIMTKWWFLPQQNYLLSVADTLVSPLDQKLDS